MHVPRGSVREVSHVKNQDGFAHIAAVDDYGRLYFWARVDAESPSSEPTWHLPEHYNIRSMDMFLTKSDGVVVCAGSDTHVHCWDRAESLSGAEPEPLWSRETGGQVRRLRLLPGDGRWPRLLAATAVIFSHGILEYWESVLESGPSWRYESPHGWMEYLDAFVDASGDVHVFATHSKGKVAEGKAESTSYYWRKAQEIEGDQPAPSWSAPNEGYFSQVEAIPGESGPGLVVALRPLDWKEGLSELRFYELGPGDPELVSSQQLKSRNNRGDEFWKEFSSIDTALDPDSGDRFLAVGYWSPYEIELWRSRPSEPNKWEPVWSFDTGDHIRSANVFGHDTQGRPYLFVGSYDNNLYSWNPDQLRTGQPTQTEFDHWVWDVDVEPQEGGVSVVVGTADGLIAYYPSFE